jgi:hypothetical protein
MQIIWFALGVALGALLTYLTAYAKKKGENFATREDLQDLVKQMSAVTEATKKIEAEISSGVWDRQKRWELRRDTLFEVAKRLTELEEALSKLNSVASAGTADLSAVPGAVLAWQGSWKRALQGWSQAADDFNRAKLLAAMVSGKGVTLALHDYGALCGSAASDLAIKNDGSLYSSTENERIAAKFRAVKAIRQDLGIDADLSTEQVFQVKA